MCLCATNATELIRKANTFSSTIRIKRDNRYNVSAKSLISLLSLNLKPGMKITVIADGNDENVALDTISTMIAG